ncbi:hypothetical protein, partial [Streptococcus pneumoniae]|uniref:hypothetical protein n=1 Tax=Streptococcus pneumoniae TaxID=1313 RepID=UPI001C546F18
SGLRQVKINSQLSYYNVFLSLRQLEMISVELDQFPTSLITFSGYIFSYCRFSFYPKFSYY